VRGILTSRLINGCSSLVVIRSAWHIEKSLDHGIGWVGQVRATIRKLLGQAKRISMATCFRVRARYVSNCARGRLDMTTVNCKITEGVTVNSLYSDNCHTFCCHKQ
jgi:hypothetical protein